MAQKPPTHIQLYFARTVRVQKAHIAGEKAPEGVHDMMRIVSKGETVSVSYIAAMDLVVAGSAVNLREISAADLADVKEKVNREIKERDADRKQERKAA